MKSSSFESSSRVSIPQSKHSCDRISVLKRTLLSATSLPWRVQDLKTDTIKMCDVSDSRGLFGVYIEAAIDKGEPQIERLKATIIIRSGQEYINIYRFHTSTRLKFGH